MAQGVKFGTNSKDKEVRIFRVKADHSMILEPKAVGDTEFAGIAEAEFISKIIGPINVSAQADGSNQVDFLCAAWGAAILDFINTYKPEGASEGATPFTAFHGDEFGGGGAAASEDCLLVVVHGAEDADTGKILGLSFLATLDPSSGSFGIEAKKTQDVTLKFNQIKPSQDLTIHDAAGAKSVWNPAVVDFAVETAAIILLEGKFKFHTALAAEA